MSFIRSIPTSVAVLLALVGASARATESRAAEPAEANAPSGDAATGPAVHRRGAWFVAVSPNFQVCALHSAAVASETAAACERLRNDLAAKCALTPVAWSPRCQIVLHASSASYEATVGAAGRSTLASALVKRAGSQIALRQIDVRGDLKDFLAEALPHELCHVLLADRLATAPLWCDEGLALQFDSPQKLQLHDRDLRRSIANGQTLPLETLLTLSHYPTSDDWPAFYGQSASVVRCLLQLGDAQQLLRFAEFQQTRNVNVALQQVYGLKGCAHLAEIWRESLRTPLAARPSIERNTSHLSSVLTSYDLAAATALPLRGDASPALQPFAP